MSFRRLLTAGRAGLLRGLISGFALSGAACAQGADRALPPSPDEVYGRLFADVQRARIFPDQKAFADSVPRTDPRAVVTDYAAAASRAAAVDLRRFVGNHFIPPEVSDAAPQPRIDLQDHLRSLWSRLIRTATRAPPGSSLLGLPYPYVVPGGRFREMYYWDSYFTMLGLRECGREDLIRSMVDDFAYELSEFGFIPNGNRTYYLTRSQPPFFSLMVQLVAQVEGESAYMRYRPALEAEYAYWTDRGRARGHVVHLPDGASLERYFDRVDTPRPEAFADDEALRRRSDEAPQVLYRNLRSAAESGWDFSSRWLADGRTLGAIQTTEVLPVDLNCLLAHLEQTLARACALSGDAEQSQFMTRAFERRRSEILRTFWREGARYFMDYDIVRRRSVPAETLAGMAPLFFNLATPAQADEAADTIRSRFLKSGGVVTSLAATGQQWDAPNGWAPLEWMTIQGLRNYGHDDLAAEIARRWMKLNRDVYSRTGKMMEKYNVEDTSLVAGGGEYPAQDGFGWTNGVYLKLAAIYRDPPEKVGHLAP